MSTNKNRIAVLADNGSLSDGIPKSEDSWHTFTQVNNYVNSIELASLNMEEGSDVYSILTAVPSPWVRAYMMKNAISYRFITQVDKTQKDGMKGMDHLYSALQDEYKGVLACMALYNSRIGVERVDLKYSDNLNFNELSQIDVLKQTNNIYELSGAFGNMLFEQAKFSKPTASNEDKKSTEVTFPFVLLITLDNVVIAGSNPVTLLYPAASYDLTEARIPFYIRGRFKNPVDYLDKKELERIFHYVGRMRKQVNVFEKEFKDKDFNIITVHSFLRDYHNEIKDKLVQLDPDFNERVSGILDSCDKFTPHKPFDTLFNVDVKIYKTKDGRYLIENETGDLQEFNPDKLLLPVESAQILMVDSSDVSASMASLLTAKGDDGKTYFFTLPLSSRGINEFQNQIEDVLGKGEKGLKYDKLISAKYDTSDSTLEVTLKLEISGFDTYFSKRYSVPNSAKPINTSVILWPNFYATNWSEYYLYSELPHGGKGIKSIPLIADNQNMEKLRFEDENNLYYITDKKKDAPASCIVEHNVEKLKEKITKYEIFKSSVPFLGIELRNSSEKLDDYRCGYILLSNKTGSAQSLKNYSFEKQELESVTVSVDFGSTNTSVSLVDKSNVISNLVIKPRRTFLLGEERNDPTSFATANEIFFFQNDIQTRALRSALVLHNTLRLSDYELQLPQAVCGGLPLQEVNIPIKSGDKAVLNIQVEDEESKVIYDLKWKREDRYLVNKKAFLKNVWLCICAELFEQGKRPAQLMWSYPHAMPKDLRRTYEGIYEEVVKTVQPIKGSKTKTAKMSGDPNQYSTALSESEAVCNYALSMGGIGLPNDSIFLGIDIGGVTSDILLLANDPGDKRAMLLKQSSVKIAGDRVAKAIGMSPSIQKCINHFLRREGLNIIGMGAMNSATASYYTNLLFEKLESSGDLERTFYSELWDPENEELSRDHTRGLIAIASYICGLLLFHSAQLTASIIKEDVASGNPKLGLEKGLNLHISTFGKGGKLFDWLPVALGEETANKFYRNCFSKGLEIYEFPGVEKDKVLKHLNYHVKRENLKMEVSLGLASPRGIVVKADLADFEILGEYGYSYLNEGKSDAMNWDSKMENKFIFELGEKLHFPPVNPTADSITGLPRFDVFMNEYISLVREWELFDYSKLSSKASKFVEINLENYVKSDEDWVANNMLRLKTQNDSEFRFSSSPFLFQGMCFLDEVLMKVLYTDDI
jgi:hypothetical protein